MFVRSLVESIGNTPILELQNTCKEEGVLSRIFAKVESVNVGGSIKDRVALAMIEDAEKRNLLKKGGVVVEATSGNTGVGLALICAVRGYRCIIVMPETMSVERQKLMKAYGAEVVLTKGEDGMQGAVQKANELAKGLGAFVPAQFENPANVLAHYQTTGKEIWTDMDGKVDIFVTGVGTGGTITGVAKYLKEKNPDVKIVAIEPSRSPLMSEGWAGTHGIQGIGANFIPKILDRSYIDEVILIGDDEAKEMSKRLGKREGVFVGISSGANVCGAIALAKRKENTGKNIVTIFPDSGDRYLSNN